MLELLLDERVAGLFAGGSQQLPARHEELEVRADGEQPGELRCCIDQMLEVVEDEQEPTVGDAVGEGVPRLQCLAGRLEEQPRIA